MKHHPKLSLMVENSFSIQMETVSGQALGRLQMVNGVNLKPTPVEIPLKERLLVLHCHLLLAHWFS